MDDGLTEQQRDLLLMMKGVYPRPLDDLKMLSTNGEYARFAPDLAYLDELGLCVSGMDAAGQIVSGPRITAKGCDLLEPDGGMTAKLREVSIRFDVDDLRKMLADKVERSDAQPEVKSEVMKRLRGLPAAVLDAGMKELIKRGINHIPSSPSDLLTWFPGGGG